MGNTQSTETEGGGGHTPTGGGGGGLAHRLSRRSRHQHPHPPAQTAATAAAAPAVVSHNITAVAGNAAMDMQTPVVGSPLPPMLMTQPIPAASNNQPMPEAIPQTLPTQGGLAQLMAARRVGAGVDGRSPRSGISDDRMMDGVSAAQGLDPDPDLDLDLDLDGERRSVPTLIRWTEPGSQVYISGSFIDWQYKIRLHEDEGMFGVVIDLPVGTHCLKYIVDGKWRCSNRFIIAPDDDGNLVNFFKVEDVVEEADQEKEDNVEGLDASALSNSPPGEYGRAIPDLAKLARESARKSEPPMLPPHLNQVLLNSSEIRKDDLSVLPVPNHVVLNHLYACSLKDNVMAVSSTSRYRGKYLTTIYYKPVM